jgi:hypothetical protein
MAPLLLQVVVVVVRGGPGWLPAAVAAATNAVVPAVEQLVVMVSVCQVVAAEEWPGPVAVLPVPDGGPAVLPVAELAPLPLSATSHPTRCSPDLRNKDN